MSRTSRDVKPEFPVCGCGGENKPLYELKNLIAALERDHALRNPGDQPADTEETQKRKGGGDVRQQAPAWPERS